MTRLLAALLGDAIDYAGLFPPASLTLAQTIDNFARYLAGADQLYLGRLILPAAQLEPAKVLIRDARARTGSQVWRVSVLLPPPVGSSIPEIPGNLAQRSWTPDFDHAWGAFETAYAEQSRGTSGFVIDSLEFPTSEPKVLSEMAAKLPAGVRCFVEVSLHDRLGELLDAIQETSLLRAKVRTGGVTPDQIPSATRMAEFLRETAARRVAFKATAGLHHPLPAIRPLTYRADAPKGLMHGFLNVILATALSRRDDVSDSELVSLLTDSAASAFQISDDRVSWRDRELTWGEVHSVRSEGFVSFGSCSFEEPLADLRELGFL